MVNEALLIGKQTRLIGLSNHCHDEAALYPKLFSFPLPKEL